MTVPDIVLFMTDQQRHDQTGYASGGHVVTPNLDALADRGARFETAYSGSTTCVPARVSMLTGVDANRVAVMDDGFTIQEGFWTIAHALRAAGYQTALVGKMHFDPCKADHGFDIRRTCEHLFPRDFTEERRLRDGFDDYHDWMTERGIDDWRQRLEDPDREGWAFPLDASIHPTEWVADQARQVLAQRDPTRPLFLIVSFPNPHEPHNPPEPYASMFAPADSIVPAEGFEVNAALPPALLEPMTVQTGIWGPTPIPSPGFLRTSLAVIRGLITHIDDAMGRVLADIDASRSVIAFTSDHGDYAGHRGLMRKVPWIPFEDLIRVPLVVAAPDVEPGLRIPDLVSTADFALTFLDYAGVEVDPTEFDSRSLRPHLTGRATAEDLDRELLCSPNSGWPTLRHGRFKLIGRIHDELPGSALFDLVDDPGETVDLTNEPTHAELAATMARQLFVRVWRPVANLELPAGYVA